MQHIISMYQVIFEDILQTNRQYTVLCKQNVSPEFREHPAEYSIRWPSDVNVRYIYSVRSYVM